MDEFFIHKDDVEKRLFNTRYVRKHSDPLSLTNLDPDDVDYEMQLGKSEEVIEICGITQKGFEHFCTRYGQTYRCIKLFHCQNLSDLSPLGALENLEKVWIDWNIKAVSLWDMSNNLSLRSLGICSAKKMTYEPKLLQTAPALEEIGFSGSIFENYPMKSLDCFAGMPAVRRIYLGNIKLENKDVSFLETVPTLQAFDFDAGMFTVEEIARMVVQYPEVGGTHMRAYGPEYPGSKSYVRVSGYRKPVLELPRQQKALDKHVAYFNELVEKYHQEEQSR